MEDFNKRFDIVDSIDYGSSLEGLKTRIINTINTEFIDSYNIYFINKVFCNILGISLNEYSLNAAQNLTAAFNLSKNEKDLYKRIQALICSLYKHDDKYVVQSHDFFIIDLEEFINLSGVNISVGFDEDNLGMLYPKGEKEFDKVLVNEVLSFMNQKSGSHLSAALKLYLAGPENYIKAAESLRRSLEEYLRFKIKNDKGLDNNIKELQRKLKEDGRDSAIRKLMGSVFITLDKYFNENSKHKDGDIDEPEIEYLIYQTGVLMRYVNNNIK